MALKCRCQTIVMNPMTPIPFIPSKRRVGRGRRHGVPSSPTPVGPVVVTAASVTVTESGDGVVHFESTGGTGPAIITAVDSVSQLEIEVGGEWDSV